MTTNNKTATSYLRAIKSSPLKILRVSRNIKGMDAGEAMKYLRFSNLKVSSTVVTLLKSAMANAENNHNLDIDNLYIKEINIGKSFTLKRFSARGRGKSSRILKRFSSIRLILEEKQK